MTVKIIPEMSVPTSVCPHPEQWSAYDCMATELEVLDFLSALVFMLKPDVIIETGCYQGHGTEMLIAGMMANGKGELWTCDLGNKEVQDTLNRTMEWRSQLPIFVLQCSGVEMIKSISTLIDFAFLDSGPDEVRCHELRALYPKLSPGGVVALHDTGIHTWLREKYLAPVIQELDLQAIYFDTPRGLALVRKRPTIYP